MKITRRVIYQRRIGYRNNFKTEVIQSEVEFVDGSIGIVYSEHHTREDGFVDLGFDTEDLPFVEVPVYGVMQP